MPTSRSTRCRRDVYKRQLNALSELPSFATSGLLVETYVTGSPADLAVLLGTIALFVPLAAVAARGLARAGRLA